MRGQELLQILTKVDMKLVNEAASPRRVRRTATRWLALAACLAVVAGAVLWQVTRPAQPQTAPPPLTIQEMDPASGIGGGGMGVVSVNTLDDITPVYLTPSENGTLPVYTHDAISTDSQVAIRRIQKAGELLGMGEDAVLTATAAQQVEIETDLAYYFYLEDKSLKLETNKSFGGVTVTFPQEIPFPEGCTFAEEYRPTRGELERLKPFLADLCREKLNMSDPVVTIKAIGAYNDGKQIVHASCSQEDGPTVSFFNLDGTAVTSCYYYLPQEYIADYPIISEEEAKERLLDGHYLGLSGYDETSRQPEERVDLLYYADPWQTVNMPYYRFFVYSLEFQADGGDGMVSVYEEYYVPAVASEYLTALPEDGTAISADGAAS